MRNRSHGTPRIHGMEMQRWQASLLLRFLRHLLLSATYPFTIRLLWARLHWKWALIGTLAYDMCHPSIVDAVRVYFNNPTFRPVTAAANANPALQSAIKRLSHLRLSPGILTDVLGYLPRSHVDACKLVCRAFRQTIEERSIDLPLHQMTVGLLGHRCSNIWPKYLVAVPSKGASSMACASRTDHIGRTDIPTDKDVGASSCVTVEALGRKLISEILEHYRTPAAKELLTLYLPRLGRYPLYSRLTEALVRESTLTYGRKVAISFPRGATHAELWPDHTDYLNETTGQWTVPYKHGLIKWRRLS